MSTLRTNFLRDLADTVNIDITSLVSSIGLREDLANPTIGANIVAYEGGSVADVLDNLVFLSDYGVVGDGIVDDTAALQAALDAAALVGGRVIGEPNHTYSITKLVIKNGLREFSTNGAVIAPTGTTDPTGISTDAVIVLQGLLTGGITVVDNCKVSLTIDMSAGDRTAILGDGCTNCEFVGNNIYGFTNSATHNHRGIRLQEGASYNEVHSNYIQGYDTPTQRGLLVELWASLDTLVSFGGFFNGTVQRQPSPAHHNNVHDNHLINGSYALNLQGGEYNTFHNNVCHKQNHRGVWSGNGSFFNRISNNTITQFTSSAILLGYVCEHNVIVGNACINEPGFGVGGEAVININTGSSYNIIANNHCDAPTNYSVYVATDSSYNLIDGNYSKNAYLAAFAVENDWASPRPANAFFSRPNYGDPTSLYPPFSTSWTYKNTEGNTFQNNIVHSGYTGRNIAAFSISHIENTLPGATPTSHVGTTLKNNRVLTSTNIAYGLFLYEDTTGGLQEVVLIGNTWAPTLIAATSDFQAANASSANLNIKSVGLVYAENNGPQVDNLVHGEFLNFANNDTTPSVKYWKNFAFNNTSPTSVTNFDDGVDGQEIVLRGSANTTIVYNASLIRTKGSVNITGLTPNHLIGFKRITGVWFEMWRNF